MTTISTSSFYTSAMGNMNRLTASTDKLQAQISAQSNITHSYDDPLAAAQIRRLQAADTLATTDATNTDAAKTSLTQVSNTLTQFTNIVNSIQTLATQASTGTLSSADKANIGAQVKAYYQQLVDLANTKDSYGTGLFGGTASGVSYTQDASGNATYVGTGSIAPVSMGGGMSVSPTMTGPEFMSFTLNGTSGDLLTTVKTLSDQLAAGTATADGITGTGGTLDQLTASLDSLTTAQTVVGTRQSWVSTAQDIQTQSTTQRTQQKADADGFNLTTAAAQLSQQILVLDASQASFTKLSSMSLFNYLK